MHALQKRRSESMAASGSVAGVAAVGAAVDIVGSALLIGASVYEYRKHPFASGVLGAMGAGWLANGLLLATGAAFAMHDYNRGPA